MLYPQIAMINRLQIILIELKNASLLVLLPLAVAYLLFAQVISAFQSGLIGAADAAWRFGYTALEFLPLFFLLWSFLLLNSYFDSGASEAMKAAYGRDQSIAPTLVLLVIPEILLLAPGVVWGILLGIDFLMEMLRIVAVITLLSALLYGLTQLTSSCSLSLAIVMGYSVVCCFFRHLPEYSYFLLLYKPGYKKSAFYNSYGYPAVCFAAALLLFFLFGRMEKRRKR